MISIKDIIDYEVKGGVCVITYKPGIEIDSFMGESIIAEKKRLQEIDPVTKFIGVINWSSVSMKGLKISQFTTEEALKDVTHVGVVHLSDNKLLQVCYRIICKFVNWFIPVVETKGIKIKFFTNIEQSIIWADEQV